MTQMNNSDHPGEHANPRKLNGYHVSAMMIAFFAVIIMANFTMAWFASQSWTGLVVKNSYVASQQYNEKIKAAKMQQSQGWKLDFEFADTTVSFRLTDKNAQPLIFENLIAIIARPVSQINDSKIVLAHMGGGLYQGQIPLSSGQWSFQLDSIGNRPYHIEGRFLVSDDGKGILQ